ncbi:hypothetical protein DEA8626_01800 [Defluviimonas aquaemixtae]|uniref:PRC-barrel domain-containing protein n=1 Tax=Albidovulum aquaemixtae TaxID=1542388 RepID=A0A2R8B6K5_9RHOB|nr:PRC-barrel domain-containing protein [Defluviimonas aquaemixtae]SPH18268.1 hypothetical protein DEA8626_01800 [Defluviimonas aquaemixtae]
MKTVFTPLAAALIVAAPTFAVAEEKPVAGGSIMGVEVHVESVVANGYSANKLIGQTVHNDQKKEVGMVHDLIVGTGGDVSLAIVEVGGFLGMGSKWVAVPAGLFEPGPKAELVLPGATEAKLKEMPAFRYAH